MPEKHNMKEFLYTVLEHVSDGIITADPTGKLYYYNRSSEQIFGYSKDEARSLHLDDLLPDWRLMDDQSVSAYLIVVKNKDNQDCDVAISVSDLPSAEGEMLHCYVIRDVTYRKLAEQRLMQAQKMEAIGVVASTIAHNFNNLLGIISGSLRLLRRTLPKDSDSIDGSDLNFHIDTIESAVHRGASQISRLMMFARPQTTQPQEGALTQMQMSEFIDQIKDLIVLSVRDNVRVTFDLEADVPPVELDVGQFESALLNMAVNASDAMPAGGSFHIKTQRSTLDRNYQVLSPEVVEGDYVCVTLSDTGTGMTSEVQEHLFEPFYTTKPKGQGTGLGMSVVYGCVTQVGGYVHVYSEIDSGTTFKIYIPVCAPEVEIDYTDQRRELATCSANGKTVLIVDDHDLMRDMAQQSFTRLGFKVLAASTSQEAYDLMRQQHGRIDLLFIDIFIEEGVDSFDLAEKLAHDAQGDCRILYTSGYDKQQLMQNYNIHDENFISKPFSNKNLIHAIQAFWPDEPF